MHSRKPFLFLALLSGLYVTLFILGCHKENKTSTPTTNTTVTGDTVSIVTTGCNITNDYITFICTDSEIFSLSGKRILWDFGDGTTYSGSYPDHLYTAPGTYLVKLFCNGVLVAQKSVVIDLFQSGSVHTAKMAGNKHWKGKYFGSLLESYTLSPINDSLVDTQFDVDVRSAGLVWLPLFSADGVLFHIDTEDTISKVLSFKSCLRTYITLYYYYDIDSIVYTNHWSATVGHGYEFFVMHTP